MQIPTNDTFLNRERALPGAWRTLLSLQQCRTSNLSIFTRTKIHFFLFFLKKGNIITGSRALRLSMIILLGSITASVIHPDVHKHVVSQPHETSYSSLNHLHNRHPACVGSFSARQAERSPNSPCTVQTASSSPPNNILWLSVHRSCLSLSDAGFHTPVLRVSFREKANVH